MKPAALIVVAATLLAAPSRDAYRAAYQSWRQADPNLERDAGGGSATLAVRVEPVAAEAAKYEAERASFLKESAAEQSQGLAPVEAPGVELADLNGPARDHVAAALTIVKRNLDNFANDPDPAIQRLRSMLDRENLALGSLSNAVAERQSAADAAKSAGAALEQARAKVQSADAELSAAMKAAAGEADREAAAWAGYYRNLADSVRGEAPAAAPTAAAPAAARTPAPAVPLARYTGAWTFPTAGLYHGPQPEFVDLVVHEENGHAGGTLFARFKVAPGSKDDPVLRFDFSGDFKTTRTQSFALETSDGAKGMIDLIPGPAFNLLEVNFQTEPKPGKIRQGNMVLVKK